MRDEDIQALSESKAISADWPWNATQADVDGAIKGVIANIKRSFNLQDRTVWNSYGSGYSSYVDCFLYNPQHSFRLPDLRAGEEGYVGLVVLFSRLSPFYVFGEGEKSWSDSGGAGYLLSARSANVVKDEFNLTLLGPVRRSLEERNWIWLSPAPGLLRPRQQPPLRTNLGEAPFTVFDYVFHWMD
jgi:hypothetical protein